MKFQLRLLFGFEREGEVNALTQQGRDQAARIAGFDGDVVFGE